jgi:transcriptional regulator with XRE-family HTH domain
MNKKNVGNQIKKRRLEKNLTQEQFGELCCWKGARGRISNYEKGRREPTFFDLTIMARALDCSFADLAGFHTPTIGLLPILPKNCINDWLKYNKLPDNVTYGNAIMEGSLSERSFIVDIEGDSMSNEKEKKLSLEAGDRVVVDPDASLFGGAIVLVKVSESDIRIRSYQKDGNYVILKAFNPNYHQIVFDPVKMEIMGIVTERNTKLIPNK